jgi:hypothetical protein
MLPTQNMNFEPSNLDQRFEDIKIRDEIDTRLGFERYQEGPEKLGWLINMHAVSCNINSLLKLGSLFALAYLSCSDCGQRFRMAWW